MPFNASGVFQRLFNWRNDRDAGIKILAERMDQEMDGIVAGINDIVQGEIDFKGPITGVYGTAAAPAFSFQEDPDTGVYRSGTNKLAASAGGTKALELRQDEVEALVNFKKGTFAIDGNFVSFEDGDHWITYNDGAGNFNIRVGNKYDGTNEVHTSNGHGAIHAAYNHEQADPEFKLRIGSSGALGATVAWAKELVAKASGVLTWGGHTIWHAGNMGTGSTLDADLLDGQEGAFYRNASNLNAGTVPLARLPVGAGNNLDADKLDGQHGSYYAPINSPNFTGTPDINDAKARTVIFDNLEATNITADGMLGFDSSQGLKIYRTQEPGEATGDGAYTVLDTANITGGANIDISNTAPNASGLEAITFSVNQGAGSDLDADKLDGQEGAFYRNAGNLNAGTVPAARLSGSYTITASNATNAVNADKVDNLHASSFARSDANDTVTGLITTARNADEQMRFGSGVNRDAYVSLYNQSTRRGYLQALGDRLRLQRDGGAQIDMFGAGDVRINGDKIMHLGNDGAGSGFDADLLDGLHAAQFLRSDVDDTGANITLTSLTATGTDGLIWEGGVNRITHNDGGGNVQIRFGHKYDGGEVFAHTGTAFYIGGGQDSAGGKLALKVASNGGAGTGVAVSWGSQLEIGPTTLEWGGNEIWHSGNDGTGSGLDADLLDGIQAASLVRGDNVNNGNTTIRADDADFVVADGTDNTTNFIWRDHSTKKLFLGTGDAEVSLRSKLWTDGNAIDAGRGNVYIEDHANDGDGAGICFRTSSNPTTGLMFSVRSSGNALGLGVGQDNVRSGRSDIYVGTDNDGIGGNRVLHHGIDAGEVGSVVIAQRTATGTIVANATYAGSGLKLAGFLSSGTYTDNTAASGTGAVLSGTWKALSHASSTTGRYATGLFVRVA